MQVQFTAPRTAGAAERCLAVTHFLIRNKRGRLRRLHEALWRLEAALLALYWLITERLRPAQAVVFGRRLLRWLGPRSAKHARVLRNLALAFPESSRVDLETLAVEIWGNFGAVLAEYPHLRRLASPARLATDIAAETRAILAQGRPAVFVGAHLGNWELVALAITSQNVPLSVVYAPQRNPFLERRLQEKRQALGCRFIGKRHALRRLLGELRAGRSVGLLPDQRMDGGEPLPFFGRLTPTPTTPAWLALKTGCPVIPVQLERTGEARYRAIFHKPIDTGGASEKHLAVTRMTAALNGLFEDWIRNRPGDWLCMKRRWPEPRIGAPPGLPAVEDGRQ
jgi:KDO2-lipid IV(A) lauroyltransferase